MLVFAKLKTPSVSGLDRQRLQNFHLNYASQFYSFQDGRSWIRFKVLQLLNLQEICWQSDDQMTSLSHSFAIDTYSLLKGCYFGNVPE